MSEPRRKPLGKPLMWSDAEIDRMSEITPEIIEQAKAFVSANAPELSKMMDAEPVENASQNKSANA
jgi:hypothetical protein